MCGKSPISVKIISVMTKLNGFLSRLTGKTFLRNMPVTLGQANDTAHLPRDLSEMPTFLSFCKAHYGKATRLTSLFQNYFYNGP